jgi:glycogen synthase
MNIDSHRQRPIYYAAVAGDIAGTYRRWRDGKRDERQTAATYSGQFFDLCSIFGRPGAASFPSAHKELVRDGSFVVRSRPPNRLSGGVWFYLDQLKRAFWLYVDVLRTKATDVIVMDGVTFFFLLAPLSWAGRRIFLSIHTVLLSEGFHPNAFQRIVRTMDGWFLRTRCAGCLVASTAIGSQLSMLGGPDLKVAMFYPLYEERDFANFFEPNHIARPFRIFFAGRIELEKGVFDLLNVVRGLCEDGRDVHLDICGEGGTLPQLRVDVVRLRLENSITIHGHLNRPEMLKLLESAHVVVVPTRSNFPEGLNQVVIEAVLARRPVVTSTVCPALQLVAPAAVEATADSPESYQTSIERLMDEPSFFLERVKAGASLRRTFFDPGNAWTAIAARLMNN